MSSGPKVWLLRIICCALLLAGCTFVFAQNTPDEDDFLQLLRTELKHNFDSLRTTTNPPYFMAYRVNKTETHRVAANFGHIYNNSSSKTVFLTIELRVGRSETDNYHFLDQQSYSVKRVALPLDENPVLIRKILQRETERAYRESILQYTDNLLNATLYGSDSTEVFHFQPMDMDQYYEPPISDDHWDADDWVKRLRYCTSDATLSPNATNASAEIIYQVNRNYLVNSENSFSVQNHTEALLNLHMESLTKDNTLEHLDYPFFAPLPEQLPDANAMSDNFHLMEVLINEVCNAPVQEYVDCPLWLSDQAVTTLMHNLVGHALENPSDGLFAGRLQQKVLPEDFSVVSDPTIKSLKHKYLNGGYIFDNEGVKSQQTTLINHGILEKFLSTRTQCPSAYSPNGHARGNLGLPSARQSNLIVKTDNPLNREQLNNRIREELRRQNVPYGIRIIKADIICDTARNLITICPTVCFKHFPDGSEQIIRDIRVSASPQQWLDNLMAGGDGINSAAISCHSRGDELPTHCVAPDLLFRRLPVLRAPKSQADHMIAHLSTTQTENDGNPSALFYQVAQDERDIDENLLTIGELSAPYYQDYLMTDAEIYTVEASEGSLNYTNEKHVRKLVPKVLVGSDLFNNENLNGDSVPAAYDMSSDNAYESFTRDFRAATESEYRKTLKQWKNKQVLQPDPESRAMPDRSFAPPTQTNDEHNFDYPTMNNLEHFAREVSSSLAKHDFLSRSGVNIYIMMGNAYFWNSEKTSYSRPISIIGMQIYGAVKMTNGEEYVDGKTIFFPCTDSLLSVQHTNNEINTLVSHLKSVKSKNILLEEFEIAPMLIEDEAVGQLLVGALLNNQKLLANRQTILYNHGTPIYPMVELLDHVVTSKKISVTAYKSGDVFDKATFVRHEKTDAEGVERQETEIIRNGELITLMGNRNVTKATPYSNGFQQLAIQNEHCFGTKGASRIDFEHKTTVQHAKLKQLLIKEAKRQGCKYAYILRQACDDNLQNIVTRRSHYIQLLRLYQVDVRTGKEVPVSGALMTGFHFFLLEDILAVSNQQTSYPVMMNVSGAKGSRDFPFAGVPTCIVAPDGILLKSVFLVHP